MEDKITTREDLSERCEKLRKEGKTIGFTSGVFDIIHAGHIDYLEKAKEKCDVLIVGVNTDSSVKQYKDDGRPINPEEDRVKVISGIESVDFVFLFSERRNKDNIESLKPDYYIKAGDYTKDQLTSAPLVEKYGGDVLIIPPKEGRSTTDVIKKILKTYRETPDGIEIQHKEKKKVIFLDRDGVINEDVEYLHEPERFKLLPGVLNGMERLQNAGFRLVVVTCQAGIGLGYFTKEDFYRVNREMLKQVSEKGIFLDKIYFSPRTKTEEGENAKTELIKRGMQEIPADAEKSIMLGDKKSDIDAAHEAGITGILVRTGHDKNYEAADFVAEDFEQAVDWILKNE